MHIKTKMKKNHTTTN